MIYDLDAARAERQARPNAARTTLLTAGAAILAVIVFGALAFWPTGRERQTPVLTFYAPQVVLPQPSFVTRPVPDRVLTLPPDIASVTFRITNQGQTGLVASDTIATTYRVRGASDLVTVAPLPLSEALPYPSPVPGEPTVRVRGRDAQSMTASGTTAIRWIESGVAFEMSSRTLTVAQLADLAGRLR